MYLSPVSSQGPTITIFEVLQPFVYLGSGGEVN
jgi:hypothetical protein